MKKLLVIGLILLGLGAAGYFALTTFQKNQVQAALPTYETEPLGQGELSSAISAIGKVRSSQSANLRWQTSGGVESAPVKVGDRVLQDDELARLAQGSLPQSVINAQSDLYNAEQALDDLETSAEQARIKAMQDIVTYEQAVRDARYTLDNFTVPATQAGMEAVEAVNYTKQKLDEAAAAFEPYKFASSGDSTREAKKEALDEAQSEYNTAIKRLKYEYDLQVAQANLEKAQQDYEKWKDGPEPGEVQAAQARIEAIQATLNSAYITAPFDGTITEALPQVGDQVVSGDLAFRLDDLTTLLVDVQVSEVDVNQLAVGQEVVLTMDAIRGKQYHGLVDEISMIGSDANGGVNFNVTVRLSDPDEAVRPGMTSEVEILTDQRENALLIPNQAIQIEDGAQVVYVLLPGQPIQPVVVTLGISSEAYSELLSGELKLGDLIVLNPQGGPKDPIQMMGGPMGGGAVEADREERPAPGGQP